MSTPNAIARTSRVRQPFVFPDPPEDPEDKMTSFKRLAATGNVYHLIQHLGNRENTLVAGEQYLALGPTRNLAGVRYPDLLVAFGVDPALHEESNAYVIADQGKPPDFVLEIASRSTGHIDSGPKRREYAALGIPEYWRFDETTTGRYHGARLAGERLADGEYVAVDILELPDGSLQGYSAVLDLHLRWEDGELVFYDPGTERPIANLADEREARVAAEARANSAEARANAEQARANAEREARAAAEARIRELEDRLGGQNP